DPLRTPLLGPRGVRKSRLKGPMPKLTDRFLATLKVEEGRKDRLVFDSACPSLDPHHHLWDRPNYRYLFPELLADVGSGHNIRGTCYEQAREIYRAAGPEELKSLGETEFVSGVAAMSESGRYGPTRCIAGIIGFVDLQLGSRAKGCLGQHVPVSDGRLRGIRNGSTWSDDPTLKTFTAGAAKGLLAGQELSRGICGARAARPRVRRVDVSNPARRPRRSGAGLPADDDR